MILLIAMCLKYFLIISWLQLRCTVMWESAKLNVIFVYSNFRVWNLKFFVTVFFWKFILTEIRVDLLILLVLIDLRLISSVSSLMFMDFYKYKSNFNKNINLMLHIIFEITFQQAFPVILSSLLLTYTQVPKKYIATQQMKIFLFPL